MPRIPFIISFLLMAGLVCGQQSDGFHPPLDIPMVLSGNFGEIRGDHFHSGIDIKTRGTIGHPVFSIEKGHVSRIKVQANGYGKSIYVDHPSGHTSVYGHLDKYRDDIAAYVEEMQYKHRSHTIDLYLKPEQFTLGKGELIAYSGNTGGSSGPHLHFEIRTSGNQHPTNVLQYGFPIRDQVSPRFLSLYLIPVGQGSHINGRTGKQTFQLVRDNGIYTVPYGTEIRASGSVGIHVEVFDYLDGASNRCGVYTLQLSVDGTPVYGHRMDEFSFSETRYVNARIDYEELIRSGKKTHRLYRQPNDRLRIYEALKNDGLITVEGARKHSITVEAVDVAGNRSVLQFQMTGEAAGNKETTEQNSQFPVMKWNEPFSYRNGEVQLELPAGALYRDEQFTYAREPAAPGLLSEIHRIHRAETPVHLPYTLSIETGITDPDIQKKLLLATFNEDNELEGAGGSYSRGAVTASLRDFGAYAIAVDSISPEVIPLNHPGGGDFSGSGEMRFTIRDNLSGIEKYEGYIDNHWVLFEYDPKNELLTYRFDDRRLKRESDHELELYVSDKQGNVKLYHATFRW